jgi:hypothetical protein
MQNQYPSESTGHVNNPRSKRNDKILMSSVFMWLAAVGFLFLPAVAQPDGLAETGLLLNTEGAFKGYTLFAPIGSTKTFLIDMDGHVVNEWESEYRPGHSAYLLENGHLLRTGALGPRGSRTFRGGGAGGCIQEFSWDGKLIWEFHYASEEYLPHHDIARLPNGNVLLLAWELKTAGEAIAAGRNPEMLSEDELWPDHIIEVQPLGNRSAEIVWEWHVWDHLVQDFDPERANFGDIAAHPERININPTDWHSAISPEEREQLEALGYLDTAKQPDSGPRQRRGRGEDQAGRPDWNHTNAIDYNPELDQIALSVLGFNEIWIIDHSTTTREAAGRKGGRYGKGGDLLYRWGNPMAYHRGDKSAQQLFAQHDVQWIAPGLPGAGNILLFNNGRGRPDGMYSSVDEIVLPVDARGHYALGADGVFGPEKAVWSYTAPEKEEFHSGHISGAQRLPNGNTLICSGASGTLFEVTRQKETVWKYVNPIQGERRMGPPNRFGPDGEARRRPFRGGRDRGFGPPPMGGPGGRGPGGGFGPPRGGPQHWDRDDDGKVTYQEVQDLPFMSRQHFDHLDMDGDGTLSRRELPQGPPPGMGPRGRNGPGRPAGPPPPPPWDEARSQRPDRESPGFDPQGPPRRGADEWRPEGPEQRRRGGRGNGGRPGGANSVFRAYRYPVSYPGLSDKTLTAKGLLQTKN